MGTCPPHFLTKMYHLSPRVEPMHRPFLRPGAPFTPLLFLQLTSQWQPHQHYFLEVLSTPLSLPCADQSHTYEKVSEYFWLMVDLGASGKCKRPRLSGAGSPLRDI